MGIVLGRWWLGQLALLDELLPLPQELILLSFGQFLEGFQFCIAFAIHGDATDLCDLTVLGLGLADVPLPLGLTSTGFPLKNPRENPKLLSTLLVVPLLVGEHVRLEVGILICNHAPKQVLSFELGCDSLALTFQNIKLLLQGSEVVRHASTLDSLDPQCIDAVIGRRDGTPFRSMLVHELHACIICFRTLVVLQLPDGLANRSPLSDLP